MKIGSKAIERIDTAPQARIESAVPRRRSRRGTKDAAAMVPSGCAATTRPMTVASTPRASRVSASSGVRPPKEMLKENTLAKSAASDSHAGRSGGEGLSGFLDFTVILSAEARAPYGSLSGCDCGRITMGAYPQAAIRQARRSAAAARSISRYAASGTDAGLTGIANFGWRWPTGRPSASKWVLRGSTKWAAWQYLPSRPAHGL